MSAILKTKTLNSKCKLYNHSKTPNTFLRPDWEEILSHVESRPLVMKKYVPLHLANKRFGYNKIGGSLRTLKTAFARNNIDTEVFAYANIFKNITTYRKGIPITSMMPVNTPANCVIDLDNSWFRSIESLVLYLEENRILLPVYICQTGPTNYHLVYSFKQNKAANPYDGIYREEKLALATMIAGFSYEKEITNRTFLLQKLKAFGIDPSYLNQSPEWDKYRVGGSLKVKNGEYYKCVGWRNLDYKFFYAADLRAWMAGEDPWDNVDFIPTDHNDLLTNTYYKKHLDSIKDMVREAVPKKYVDQYADFLCNNLTYLKQGKLFISQLRLSSEFGIPQTTVSRHLKELVKAGVIETDNAYMKARVPKKYSAGSKIQALQSVQNGITIHNDYEDGMTNTQMLSDIRVLVAKNMEDSEIVNFISKKMQKRPKHKRRSNKDIRFALRL